LVENSIDAEAKRIESSYPRAPAAASLIRVIDNGAGMDRDDALLSLERHATSKIRTGQDLAQIRTLGFRGEALPSIASVFAVSGSLLDHRTMSREPRSW